MNQTMTPISTGPIKTLALVMPVDDYLTTLLAPLSYELLIKFDDDNTLWEMISEYIYAKFFVGLITNPSELKTICGELIDIYIGSRECLPLFIDATRYVDENIGGASMSIKDYIRRERLAIRYMYPVGVGTMRQSLCIIVECGHGREENTPHA